VQNASCRKACARPQGPALLGNLLDFRSGDLLSQWRALHRRYGETIKISWAARRLVLRRP
jgi:hypothetical protein